jgi:hypothetical protein
MKKSAEKMADKKGGSSCDERPPVRPNVRKKFSEP